MKIQELNKVFGILVILTNLFGFIPMTWGIIISEASGEGFEYIMLLMNVCFHFYFVTGIFSLLAPDKLNTRIFRRAIITSIFLEGPFSILNIALGFITIYKKINIEQALLITNIIGFIEMVIIKMSFN